LNRDSSNVERIRILVEEQGADPNIVNLAGYTPLMVIINTWGNGEIGGPFYDKIIRTFEFLVGRADVDVLVADLVGNMAIHFAVLAKNSIFLRILLGNINVRRNIDIGTLIMGHSAIHIACNETYTPIENIKLLLSAGADPNKQCPYFGRTPLQFLMQTRGLAPRYTDWVIAVLHVFFDCPTLRLGDPSIRDVGGDTLLHIAVRDMRSRRVIEMLLDKGEGANMGAQNNVGDTQMAAATSANNAPAIDALQNYIRRRRFGRGTFGIA
jgi:ankyrin repeat protein